MLYLSAISIVGRKSFCWTTNAMLISRAAGFDKVPKTDNKTDNTGKKRAGSELALIRLADALPKNIARYSNRYMINKLKSLLRQYYGVVTLPAKPFGILLSTRLTEEELLQVVGAKRC